MMNRVKAAGESVTQRELQSRATATSLSSRVCRAVCMGAALYAIFGGSITLAGWTLDVQRLTDWNNDGISMFPNTAICAVLGGIGLLLLLGQRGSSWRPIFVSALGAFVALVGGLTLLQHITDWDLGIDTLLLSRPWGQRASAAPMRMGPPASTSFLLLGVALYLAARGPVARRFASELALLIMAISLLSLIGYWFGADQLFLVARVTGIALQTSTMIAALTVGLMTAVPEYGLVAALRRDDAGGTVLRRLIVPIVVLPLVLGWLRILGQEAELYDTAFGTAIRSLIEIIVLLGLLWWTANGISKHAQAARLAEEANREADRRKDEFLATLAHELRNPLAPIGNALQLMQHAEGDPIMLQHARDTMQRQFAQMVRLVDDLLDVSRITRDKLELRKEQVELQSIIHQAVETARPLAERAGHELCVDLPPPPSWIYADPVRLSQVFNNLLNNACKFTESAGLISVSAEQQGGDALVTVKDTGIGISAENLRSIFEMFEQIDNSLERTRGGLGIGLTLVKRLVELHGGRIDASSQGLGRGSEFVVRLPAIVTRVSSAPSPSPGNSPSGARRILVTDDNRDAANSLAMLLKLGGHEVATAYDGIEAVEKAESYKPEVILLDIGLPGMNGYEVCRSIRQEPWGQGIRIVAVTGWGQEHDRRNTRDAGFDHHLVKPVTAIALSEALAS
jgi:signal transduction histidine kinase